LANNKRLARNELRYESDRKSVHSAPRAVQQPVVSKAERGGTEFQRLSFSAIWVNSVTFSWRTTAPIEVIYALHVINQKYYIKMSDNI